jgi:predicted AAA+ superfamily ATPase
MKTNFTIRRLNVKSTFMIERPFWIERVEQAWRKATIVWLTGVRRIGKTTLAKHWHEALFLNCDLPRNRELLADPESFFRQLKPGVVVLDEIHQNAAPSEILKIAADEFPHLRILATGSSTLAATRKFKDSLTGRKRVVHLHPILAGELPLFGGPPLEKRLLHGGLPDRLLADEEDPEFYGEWMDSYFARDVQQLFAVAKRHAFLTLCELLLRQSGQLLEITSLARHCGLSRPTVMNYLEVLEATHLLHLLRPYHGGGRREIIAQPKAYGFDTGFVSHFRGWESFHPEHGGLLLEHLVLDLLRAHFPQQAIHYWRDKQQREIDFVLPGKNAAVTVIECKWSRSSLNTGNLDAFRSLYPKGRNILVTGQAGDPFDRKAGKHSISICAIQDLATSLLDQK